MKIALKEFFNNRAKEIKPTVHQNEDEDNLHIHEDYVTKCMGSFGLYQVITCTIAGLTRFLNTWNLLSIIFLAPATDFKCIDFANNFAEDVQNSTCYEDCVKYEYDQKVFRSTLVSQYGLVCDKAWLVGFTQDVLMFGVSVGSLLFGWMSDRFGRCNAIRLATLLNIISMLATLYSPNYWTFIALRFFVGVSSGGILVITTVYILEVVGSDHREVAACWTICPDGIAIAMLPIFAYYSETWDIFLMEYGAASVLIFFLTLTLLETPRWLVAHGKEEKAIKVVTKAARWNNLDPDHIEEVITKSISGIKRVAKEPKSNHHHHFHLFDTRELCFNTICVTLLFSIVGIEFYGIVEFTALVDSDIYISVIVFGLIQIPFGLLSIILNKFYSRRFLIMAVFLPTSITMIIQTFIPVGHWSTTYIGMMGFSSIIIAFAVLSIYVAEVYPTPIRSLALGVTISGSMFGAIIMSFIVTALPRWVTLLGSVVLPCVVVAICFLLPETKSHHLADTLR